ncbi:MAG: hypothetical protein K1X88_34690 [Nannocystaceae bacterium]|nr:hypothetical protein [Nannocystaceae bacterium]
MGSRSASARELAPLALAALVSCTVDQPDDPFGVASAAQTSVGLSTTVTAGGDDGSSSGSSGSGSGSSEGGASSSSDGGAAGSSGEVGSSGGAVESSGGDPSGGGNGMQPADGMYSPCTTAQECGFTPILCITIVDMMGNPVDGFCSETGCQNPAVDCDPTPGGTATPICVPVSLDGMDEQACALDCSGGKVCPQPMSCNNVMGLGMVCA